MRYFECSASSPRPHNQPARTSPPRPGMRLPASRPKTSVLSLRLIAALSLATLLLFTSGCAVATGMTRGALEGCFWGGLGGPLGCVVSAPVGLIIGGVAGAITAGSPPTPDKNNPPPAPGEAPTPAPPAPPPIHTPGR